MQCPLCLQHAQFDTIFQHTRTFISCGSLSNMPHNTESSEYASGNAAMTLMQCRECGFLFNASFNANSMQKEYASYLPRKVVSRAMNTAIQTIKDSIMHHYAAMATMGGGGIIEIAPGSGDLAYHLAQECEFLYTIDPSIVSLEIEKTKNSLHIQGFFTKDSIQPHIKHNITCIVFRHLLEHIDTPRAFLQEAVSLLQNGGIIYVEVPNILEFFEHARFYEVFHDHCGYYQESVLINTLCALGMEYIDSLYLYQNQHMGLFFKKTDKKCAMSHKPTFFSTNEKERFLHAVQALNEKLQRFQTIALYGAGAHGHSLLSFLTQENKQKIACCFDLDSRKHAKYLQNSSIMIQKPCKEQYKDVECIVLAVPLYEEEVFSFLKKSGFCGEIVKSLDCSNL